MKQRLHILPLGHPEPLHHASLACWCQPLPKEHGEMAIHNAKDVRVHPTQKPLALMTWCLGLVPDAKTVLDPFAGSGTTGRACKDLGRSCVMIEREEIARRMAQEVLGLTA